MHTDNDMLTDVVDGPDAAPKHPRTIIHIDIDCFYAQVEELLCPELRTKPVGIQQKNIIVTGNYVARSFGVGKLQLLSDALKACPDLVLVNGEDLTKYRKMSAAIFEVLHTFTPNVEKLGMDENYMDVSSMIAQRMDTTAASTTDDAAPPTSLPGHQYPVDEKLDACRCGCARRLRLGAVLAKEIRDKLSAELGITSCAGVAHNKLLAKWVGARNKPNAQTVFAPLAAGRTMRALPSVRQITGIGEKTEVLLKELHIVSVAQLQDVPLDQLKRKFGADMSAKLKEWSFGRDSSAVKPSGRPKSIGLEDSCRSISVRADVEDKFRLLLIRLIEQVLEDGRIPIVIKITVRKFDGQRRSSHRETKQANVPAAMFRATGDGKVVLTEGGQEKLLKIVMHLFERSVNLSRPFNITLLGLAFSKFQERRKGPSSRHIANFLIKKSDVEVQSIMNLSSEGYSPNASLEHTPRYCTSSPMHVDFESVSDTSHASCSSDVSESEVEPSPKKTRIGLLIAKRRCFLPNESTDLASPSKLRVSDLRLSGDGSSANFSGSSVSPHSSMSTSLFGPTSPTSSSIPNLSNLSVTTTSKDASASNSSSLSDHLLLVDCPPSVDASVFRELPADVQQELLAQWRSTATVHSSTPKPATRLPSTTGGGSSGAAAAVNAVSSASSSPTAGPSTGTPPPPSSGTASKSNTLHRYFIANSQH